MIDTSNSKTSSRVGHTIRLRSFAIAIWCLLIVVHNVQNEPCNYELVESMPDGLKFDQTIGFSPTPTHEALIDMIDKANETIRLASFYMTLMAEPKHAMHPSTKPGRNIFESLLKAAGRGVDLEVILDNSGKPMSNEHEITKLKSVGAKLNYLNMTKLLKSGVLHSKFMIADNKSIYVGSSNFDWRSYTQIKEIGIKFNDCPVLSSDLDKIFQIYNIIGTLGRIPSSFPMQLHTEINMNDPLKIDWADSTGDIFLASSPPDFNGKTERTGRTDDIEGLLSIIDSAHGRIDISVMNYGPRTAFIWPKQYWPRIDDALRRAATVRHVSVRLLFSNWSHAKPEEIMWYKSLDAINSPVLRGGGIKVKLFQVPVYDDFQRSVPYARVKHDKYMVTDNGLYIGTSNWTPDYFINTCGVSYVIRAKSRGAEMTIVQKMQRLFDRDFNSPFAHDLPR